MKKMFPGWNFDNFSESLEKNLQAHWPRECLVNTDFK